MSLSDLPTGTVSEPTSRTYPAGVSLCESKRARRPGIEVSSRAPRSDGGEPNGRLPYGPPPEEASALSQQSSAQSAAADTSSTTPQQRLESLEARIRQLEAELEHVKSERQAVIDHYEGLLAAERSRTGSEHRRREKHPIRRLLGL